MPVAIVSDTCHYLPRAIVDRLQIHEVSLYVTRNGSAERESEIVDYDAYYSAMAHATELPSTSQPSIGDFLGVYEPLLEAGNEIVSIHLSGGLSGTVGAAEQAREQLGDRARRVTVVDSGTACGAEGLMVMAAAAAIRDGGDAAAAAEQAHRAHSELGFLFALDTLEYLRKGGRVGGAQAWLGTALQIKPILSLESEIGAVERVRTSRRAFERLVRLAQELKDQGRDGWAVQYTHDAERARALADRASEIFGREAAFISEVGPVIGAHIGPGLLGIGAIPASLL
jgi:DegV family protein with EDD domain